MIEAVEFTLQSRQYRVACRPEDREDLLKAVEYVQEKMRSLSVMTDSTGERLAMTAAVNIAHEYINYRRTGGFDFTEVKGRINHMTAEIEAALQGTPE